MTRARRELISIEDTPYYHCISRCVRRAYLCGEDFQSGQNFDHRKIWLVERIKFLASVFSIDVCAYAVMSNHYHLVLFVNQDELNSWSDEEVMDRWGSLFPASTLRIKDLLNATDNAATQALHQEKVDLWRKNLGDISWFMRSLNEYVARTANKEENCRGRFWEGRFKSQALLDEKALLSCMAYVDLNPIRAKMVATPEESDFTSIQERLYDHAIEKNKPSVKQKRLIRQYKKSNQNQKDTSSTNYEPCQQASLKVLDGSGRIRLSEGIPYSRQDYFELVDWTGRVLRSGKRGAIDESQAPILQRLGIDEESWIESVARFQHYFFDVAGSVASLEQYQKAQNQHREKQKGSVPPIERLKGKSASRKLYG